MKKVLLIGFTSHLPGASKLAKYQHEMQEAVESSATVDACFYDEISFLLAPGKFVVKNERNGKDLASYDFVIFRGAIRATYMPYCIGRYLKSKGVAYLNDYSSYRSLAKLPQLVDMYELGLPFPKTLFMQNKHLLQEKMAKDWKFPLIVKTVSGSKGRLNYLVHSAQEMQQVLEAHPNANFLVQQYIPSDSDYRILVMDQEVLVINRKAKDGSHLNNLAKGATLTVIEEAKVPGVLIEQSRLLAKKSAMPLSGVDVIRSQKTGRHYFLEINSQPGWRTLEVQVKPQLTNFLRAKLKN